jgi:hypothetical protein
MSASRLVDFSATDRVTKVVEVADHHRREIRVELANRRRTDPEAVGHPCGDEDERPGRARDLAVVSPSESAVLYTLPPQGVVLWGGLGLPL